MLFLHNILNSVWMIDLDFASNYLPVIANYIKGNPAEKSVRTEAEKNTVLIASAGGGNRMNPSNAPKAATAIINITGAMTKYDQDCGPDGMKTYANLLQQCYASDNIGSIILVIDSGGGEAGAMRLMAETISQKNKPVGCFIDDNCCSAAYGLASACDFICANSSMAQIGSIGTYGTVVDFSKQLEMMGVNIIEIYATASTDKNKPFIDAINGKPEALQAIIDTYNENFLSLIETNRADQLKADRKVWGTGKVFFADKALELGLIDGIDTLENFINYFNL